MKLNALIFAIIVLIVSLITCDSLSVIPQKENEKQLNAESIEGSDPLIEGSDRMGLKLKESLDYEVNKEENRATEPPERDQNSELVDENRLKEQQKDKDNKIDKSEAKAQIKVSQNNSKSKRIISKNENENQLKRNDSISCLESADSGFWCNEEVTNPEVTKLETRFYYERESQQCKCMSYYGCDGNANNFLDIKDCIKECNKFGYRSEGSEISQNCQIIP